MNSCKVDKADMQFTSKKNHTREINSMITKTKQTEYSGKDLAHAVLSNEAKTNL